MGFHQRVGGQLKPASAVAGPVQNTLTIFATQAQAAVVVKQAQAIRTVVQTPVAFVVKQTAALRIAAQAQLAQVSRTFLRTLITSQASVALVSSLQLLLRTIAALQGQTASVAKQAQAIRLATELAGAQLVKQVQSVRTAGQAQAAGLLKQVQAVRIAAQAQLAQVFRTFLRTLITTQAQVAATSALRVLLRTIVTTQAAAAQLAKQAQLVRVLGQASAAAVGRSVQAIRTVGQAQLALSVKTVLTTRVVSQASIASLSAFRVLMRTILALQAQRAAVGKQVQAVRIAGQAQVALLTRQVQVTRVAVQASSVSIGKLIGKVLTTVQNIVASALGFNPGAATPRVLTLLASSSTVIGWVSAASQLLGDGAVGFWRLGDAAGLVAADSANVPHAGTISGGVTLGQPGAWSDGATAMLFNGTSGHIKVATFDPLNGVASCTLEAWVNHNGIAWRSGPSEVVQYWGLSALHYLAVGNGIFSANLSISGVGYTLNGIAVPTTGWHHLALTWSSGDQIRLYLDGVQVGNAGPHTGTLDSAPGLVIASDANPASWFNGTLDDVTVSPIALTAAQVAAHAALKSWPTSGPLLLAASSTSLALTAASSTTLPLTASES